MLMANKKKSAMKKRWEIWENTEKDRGSFDAITQSPPPMPLPSPFGHIHIHIHRSNILIFDLSSIITHSKLFACFVFILWSQYNTVKCPLFSIQTKKKTPSSLTPATPFNLSRHSTWQLNEAKENCILMPWPTM